MCIRDSFWASTGHWSRLAIERQKKRAETGEPDELHKYALMLLSRDDNAARQVQRRAVKKQPEVQLFNWYRMFEVGTEIGEKNLIKSALIGDIRAQQVLVGRLLSKAQLSEIEFWQLYAWRKAAGPYQICYSAFLSGNTNLFSVCQGMVNGQRGKQARERDRALEALLCHMHIEPEESL